MSRKGNPYDNAFAESFMKTLKSEEVHLWEYRAQWKTPNDEFLILSKMFTTISGSHSAIGYCPPNEYEFYVGINPKPLSGYSDQLALICAVLGGHSN